MNCPKYKWESASKRYKLIEIENILRVVHVVPIFKGGDRVGGEFYHNKFHFKSQDN